MSKEMEKLLNNDFNESIYKDVYLIRPNVVDDIELMEQKKKDYYKVLKTFVDFAVKENNCTPDDILIECTKKIRFVIEDKFAIDGKLDFDVEPNFNNGIEEYNLVDFDVNLDIAFISPLINDNIATYTMDTLLNNIKSAFVNKPFMYYSDTKPSVNIIYDFQKYINPTFLYAILNQWLLYDFNVIEIRKKGHLIKCALLNENSDKFTSIIFNENLKEIPVKYHSLTEDELYYFYKE